MDKNLRVSGVCVCVRVCVRVCVCVGGLNLRSWGSGFKTWAVRSFETPCREM